MSDNVLRLIPKDARYKPPPDAAAAAAEVIRRALPLADGVDVTEHPAPVFIDQGTNFEAMICGACRRRLAIDGEIDAITARRWWSGVGDTVDRDGAADA